MTVPAADLHLHTDHSDGADAPARVVQRAAQQRLTAIAITDHDTTAGIPEAETAAQQVGIELLPAVEISTGFRHIEVHVLAYGIALRHQPLQQALAQLRTARAQRATQILARLDDLGVRVPREVLDQESGQGAIGRLHIARCLRSQGYTKTLQEGFDRYIGQDRPAFVPKATLPAADAIELIHDAGGIAVIAHPALNPALKTLLPQLLLLPFDGIEAYHNKHSPGEAAQLMECAVENGLLVTGGSDCHGNIKGQGLEIGKVRLAYHHYQRLKEAIAQRS
jgi:3',5'-nucleoside bisphosphate phosphatase